MAATKETTLIDSWPQLKRQLFSTHATTKDTDLLDSWPQIEKDQAVVRLFFSFLNICLLTISALPSKDTEGFD